MGTGNIEILEWEQGFKHIDGDICSECINDKYIQNWIENNYESKTECKYCGKIHKCVSMDTFAKKIMYTTKHYFEDTNEYGNAVYEGEICTNYYQPDVLEIISEELNIDFSSLIIQDLLNHGFAEKRWCPASPFSLKPYDFEKYTWEAFCKEIKNENNCTRDYLELLGTIVDGFVDYNMISDICPTETLYRCRGFKYKNLISTDKKELVSPPASKAWANRMSEVGESVFYCSPTEKVALKEAENSSYQYYVCAKFNTTRNFKCLDLTKLSPENCPSWFDIEKEDEARKYYFHNYLCSMLTKPFNEDVEQEYTPIQKFAHYCKQNFDGIIYQSAKVRTDKCYVLFITHEDCLDNPQCPFSQPAVDMIGMQKYKLENSKFIPMP